MSHGRLLILVILALSACSKNTAPSAPAASSTTDPAATTAPAQTKSPDGSTQLATEPDGVHIEYRVAGKGDPAIVLIHGVHAIRVIEDMQCVSVKQGPFFGDKLDRVNVSTK